MDTVSVISAGDWNKTVSFLEWLKSGDMFSQFNRYGRLGVDALSRESPRDTGLMAESWGYQISIGIDRASIGWFNTDVEGGVNVAVIVQYGHGTGTGGWVEGRDYINPAMQPIFDKIVEDIWRQVRNA